MRRGFTLIELLAVIVILAIIALIAVPIVLNIIDDSKESSLLRSAEFYLDAVEYTIADAFLYHGGLNDGDYPITPSGDICKVNESPCTDANILKVEVNGDKPTGGSITISNGNIEDVKIVLDEKTIVKNTDGTLIYQDTPTGPTLASLCEFKEGTEKAIGAKYECDFGGGARNFYILELGSNKVEGSSLKSDEVALILEGNYDTTTQPWCNPNGANPYDNVCAADGLTSKLNEIAGVWTKLERSQIVLPSALQIIVANDPSKNTVEYTEGIQSWLYSWDNSAWGNTVYGYWTSNPYGGVSYYAWRVHYDGLVHYDYVEIDNDYGVRPVVNLKLD